MRGAHLSVAIGIAALGVVTLLVAHPWSSSGGAAAPAGEAGGLHRGARSPLAAVETHGREQVRVGGDEVAGGEGGGAQDSGPVSAPDGPSETPEGAASWKLELEIEGATGPPLPHLVAILQIPERVPIEIELEPVRPGERARTVDLTDPLERFWKHVHRVEVRAIVGDVPIAAVSVDPKRAIEARDASGAVTNTLRATLELPRTTVLRGVVRGGDGLPVPEAAVAAYFGDPADGAVRIAAESTTSDEGAFALPVGRLGSLSVVVADGRHRPWVHPLELSAHLGEHDLGAVRLSLGHSIAGRMVPSGSVYRVDEVELYAAAVDLRGTMVDCGPHDLYRMSAESFEYTRVTTRTSQTGFFRFSGLAPGRYWVTRWGNDHPGRPTHCALAGAPRNGARVESPVEGVVLELTPPSVAFSVTDGESPIRGAEIRLTDVANGVSGGCYTSEDGRAIFATPPGLECEAVVSEPGYVTKQLSLRTPDHGVIEWFDVTLEPMRETGTVVVVLSDGDGAPIEKAHFAFLEPGDDESSPPSVEFGRATDGSHTIEGIPEGAYSMKVRAAHDWNYPRGFSLDETVPVDVRTGETTEVEVALEWGGRLAVRIVDESGRLVPASCRIEDDAGNELDVPFYAIDRRRNRIYLDERIPHDIPYDVTDPDARGEVQTALPAGRYELYVALDGHEPERATAEVVERELTVVEVVLVPTP